MCVEGLANAQTDAARRNLLGRGPDRIKCIFIRDYDGNEEIEKNTFYIISFYN